MRSWLSALFLLLAISADAQEISTEGLEFPKMVRDIYLGRFALVLEEDYREGLSEAHKSARVKLAFLSYHGAWDQVCGDSSREPLVTRTWTPARRDDDSTPKTVRVRKRFAGTFARLDKPGALALEAMFGGIRDGRMNLELVTGMIVSVSFDADRIIANTGCSSATLAQYEENLQRVVDGQEPVQNTKAWPARAPLFAKGCSNVMGSMTARPKASSAQCDCIHRTLAEAARPRELWELEDAFDRHRFLALAVSRVGLIDKVGKCVQ